MPGYSHLDESFLKRRQGGESADPENLERKLRRALCERGNLHKDSMKDAIEKRLCAYYAMCEDCMVSRWWQLVPGLR